MLINALKEFEDALNQFDLTWGNIEGVHLEWLATGLLGKGRLNIEGHKDLVATGEVPSFVKKWLDREYDSGFGTQYLDGIVWFDDGSWATREEYDGSERWRLHRRPELPTIERDAL